ncbi:hypothetical protein QTP88_008727 [Uroleucon formosanum]
MFPGNGAGSSGTQSSSTGTKKRRLSNLSTSPSVTAKNRYSPLLNANDNSDMDLASSSEGEDNQQDKVSQKIPPIYAYNITDFDNFHKSLSEITTDEFTINHTKNALKLNLSSIDDYRSITKKFDDTEIQYHTYQFPLDKQLSLIIRNLPVSISEKSIFEALSDLDYKVTNRLLNQETNIIPPLRTSSRLVKSDEEKYKVFSENLRNTFSLNQIANNSNDLRIEQILKTPNYSVQNSLNYVTPNEIKLIIKRLPAKKSPGHDRITNLLLKKLPNKAILYTTSLFNALLRLGCFPVNWKKAIVILIKKPGKDNTNPDITDQSAC